METKFNDTFLEVKNIKKGDTIYECSDFGINYEFKALTDSFFHGDGWKCILQDNSGSQVEIFVSGGTKSMYKPKIYTIPQFLERDKNEFFYPIK